MTDPFGPGLEIEPSPSPIDDLQADSPFEPPMPVVEKSRAHGQPKLQIAESRISLGRWLLAITAAMVMALYLASLLWLGRDQLRSWWPLTDPGVEDAQAQKK